MNAQTWITVATAGVSLNVGQKHSKMLVGRLRLIPDLSLVVDMTKISEVIGKIGLEGGDIDEAIVDVTDWEVADVELCRLAFPRFMFFPDFHGHQIMRVRR